MSNPKEFKVKNITIEWLQGLGYTYKLGKDLQKEEKKAVFVKELEAINKILKIFV